MAIKINPDKAKQIEQKNLPQKLDEVFMSLDPEIRGQFYALKAGVKIALEQGDTLGALAVINVTSVPEELKPVKDQMLALFQ